MPFALKAQEKRMTPEQRQALSLDSFVFNITESVFTVVPEHTQFAYCVIEKGELRFFGFEKDGGQIQQVSNKDAVFELGSLTKLFTSLLFSDMVNKGTFKPEDKVGSFFDQPLKAGNEKTLISLSNHTSGFPRIPDDLEDDLNNPYKDYSYQRLENYLYQQLSVKDTIAYDYSNLGPATLEYIIAKKSGMSFEEYLQKLVFESLQMNRSSTDITKIKKNLVQGQDSAGNPCANWEMNAFVGAGGLYSSVNDLSKWVLHYMEQKDPVYNQTLETTFEVLPQFQLAWGWHILKSNEGMTTYLHNGGTNGYSCTLLMDVENKNGVILLSNLSAFHPYFPFIDKTANNIMRKLNKMKD